MKMNQIDLSSRVAAITGGGGGLGLAVARQLLAAGARVSLWGRDSERLEKAVATLVSDGYDASMIDTRQMDVTRYEEVEQAVGLVQADWGSLDILVCNAGTGGYTAPCADFPLDEWDRQLAINLSGVFYCCRAAIPGMKRAGWGRIVNVSSMAGKDGNALQAGYAASKAGVIALTKSLGKELASTGVLVNAVAPTMFDSPMSRRTRERMPTQMLQRLMDSIPMGRLGEADELAALIAWICSPQNSFTTGFTYDFSGGRTTY